MQVRELFKNINTTSNIDIPLDITGLNINSHNVSAGDCYICIKGTKLDGHDFAADAVKSGAKLVVCEHPLPLDVPQIVVDDTRESLGLIAANFYHHPRDNFKLIGITGTNGKTTTTYMVKNILECAGQKVGVIGTIGVMIGNKQLPATLTTPDPIELHRIFRQMADNGVDTVVMEVSAHAIALKKMSGIICDVGVLTNVTQDHLDFFGTFEHYAATKSRFIKPDYCKLGIVNADDETGLNIVVAMQNCAPKNFHLLSYGLNNPADNFATNIKYELHGTHYFLNILDDIACINTRLIGEFNIYNALAAASACRAVGADMQSVKLGLNSMEFVPGRINVIRLPNGASVVIDYAHTPDGLENILLSVRKITKGKMYSVFGCGGNRDKSKRAIMGEISGRLADFTVLTSDNPRLEPPEAIIDDIRVGISQVSPDFVCIPDRVDAIHYVLSRLTPNDVAVLAGKGAEDYLDIGGRKIHYSDFETVENESRKIWHEVQKC